MLFDLRGRGRRRTVQVIYATLAILLGGGLVLFGIGGDVQGGLIDGIFGTGGGGDDDLQEDEAKDAREAVQRNPRDARAWAVLAEKEYQLARVSDGLKRVQTPEGETLEYTGDALARAQAAERAWDRHIALVDDPKKALPEVAVQMAGFFASRGNFDKALTAQAAWIESLGDRAAHGDFSKAAQFAYLAGKLPLGDNYRRRSLELAPDKAARDQIKASLDRMKAEAQQAAVQEAQANNPPPAPPATRTTPKSKTTP